MIRRSPPFQSDVVDEHPPPLVVQTPTVLLAVSVAFPITPVEEGSSCWLGERILMPLLLERASYSSLDKAHSAQRRIFLSRRMGQRKGVLYCEFSFVDWLLRYVRFFRM